MYKLALVLAYVSLCASAQEFPSNVRGPNWEVKIETVRKVATVPKPLYRLTVSYSFLDRTGIWIDGLGMVVPQDSVTFTTLAPLRFREAKGKSPIVTLPIASVVSQPLERGIEYPLSVTSPSSLWKSYGTPIDLKRDDKMFASTAMKALQQPSNGSTLACRLDDDGCIFTAWFRVFTGDRSKGNFNQGDISVMLVHKPTSVGGQPGIHFACYYLVRQGLAGSPDWDYTGGIDVQKAAMQFLDHLLSQLSDPIVGGGR
jgi:hypothetical protein